MLGFFTFNEDEAPIDVGLSAFMEIDEEEEAEDTFQRIGGMGVGRQIVGPQQIL